MNERLQQKPALDRIDDDETDAVDRKPEPAWKVQMKQSLAGKPYGEQVADLRPPMPQNGLYPSMAAPAGVSGPLQMSGGGGDSSSVHQTAAKGVSGSGGALPHSDKIQQSFGGFDVSSIKAHTGSQATQANKALGAEAYATGSNIAFKSTPSLHTAAHEAAHVVQQAQGVNLPGGVGSVGDKYEKHADSVADAVVSGKSAEGLLAGGPSGGGGGVQKKAVQRAGTTTGSTGSTGSTGASGGSAADPEKERKDKVMAAMPPKLTAAAEEKGTSVISSWKGGEIGAARLKRKDTPEDDDGFKFSDGVTATAKAKGVSKVSAAKDKVWNDYFKAHTRRAESTLDTAAFKTWLVGSKSQGLRTEFLTEMGKDVEGKLKSEAVAVSNNPAVLTEEVNKIAYDVGKGTYGKFNIPKDHAEEHDKYKPVGLTWNQDKTQCTYTYAGMDGINFTANLNAGDEKLVKSIKGEGLKLKKAAQIFARGRTTGDAGRKITKKNQDASHLIADEFMGSGFKSSQNIVTTSDVFNRETMRAQEVAIGKIIQQTVQMVEEDDGADAAKNMTFDLTVSVEWTDVMSDEVIKTMIASETFKTKLFEAYPSFKQGSLKTHIQTTLSGWMKGMSENLRRVKNVKYKLDIPEAGYSNDGFNTGPDLFMGVVSMGGGG